MASRKLGVEQTQELIDVLASRMGAEPRDRIDIKIGKDSVYRGAVGESPEYNKLTPTRADMLRAAVDLDGTRTEDVEPGTNYTKSRSAISLEKNGEEVFRLEKGQLVVDKLPARTEVAVEEEVATPITQSPIETFKEVVENSSLASTSNVRRGAEQFAESLAERAQEQQSEAAKNWLWFALSRSEERRGQYEGSVSVGEIQQLAMQKVPVPDGLRAERDAAVERAEQYAIAVAQKALEQQGNNMPSGERVAAVGGYQITQSQNGDLTIEKPVMSFLNHDTGQINQSVRPNGVLKVEADRVTVNRLMVKDLDKFEYIEKCLDRQRENLTEERLALNQATKEVLPMIREVLEQKGYGKVLIENWKSADSTKPQMKEMVGKTHYSEKMGLTFVQAGKHLQARDKSNNLQMKAFGDTVDRPFTGEQIKNVKQGYEAFKQWQQERAASKPTPAKSSQMERD